MNEPGPIVVDELPREPAAEAAWDAFVAGRPEGSVYHRSVYRALIAEATGHDPQLLRALSGGRLVGVLPLVHLRSAVFGNYFVGLPYFNHCGVLAESDAARNALLDAAADRARWVNATHVELRQLGPVEGHPWPGRSTKVEMLLDLPDSPGALWQRFRPKLRAQIRRPTKAGLYARIGDATLLEDFYGVFARNMRDLGTPVYAPGFFRAFLRHQPERTRICVVYRAGRPVGGGIVVGDRETLEIPWASTVREANPDSPNMLLYWKLLEYAVEAGYRRFDFGRSTPGEGTFAFKKQWGAEPVPLHWYYWLRDDGPLPELNPKNPRYQLAIRAWQRLPVPLTRLLGPPLVKNLP
jgi:serine/alanine adding enzyme